MTPWSSTELDIHKLLDSCKSLPCAKVGGYEKIFQEIQKSCQSSGAQTLACNRDCRRTFERFSDEFLRAKMSFKLTENPTSEKGDRPEVGKFEEVWGVATQSPSDKETTRQK